MSNNRCICCGEIIPEGRHVCPRCERLPLIYTPNTAKKRGKTS